MGGFLGIGGSSAKTDRSVQLQSFGGLNNLFNWALPQAKSAVGTGLSTLKTAGSDIGSAAGFFRNLMSGNRSVVNQVVAPQANTAQTQADAERRQQVASGTARGGGTAGPAQTQKDQTLAQIQNMLFGARTAGASGTLEAGRAEAGVGATEGAIGTNIAGVGESAVSNMGALATNSRQTSLQQQNVLGAAFANLLFG